MNAQHLATITTELGIAPRQIEAVAALLADGATVPFIARYRKEATGSLDESRLRWCGTASASWSSWTAGGQPFWPAWKRTAT
jgi:transcriptional accessory protein Tex/SPT6